MTAKLKGRCLSFLWSLSKNHIDTSQGTLENGFGKFRKLDLVKVTTQVKPS